MKTIAIGSGKGGVGKTTLTANLAITLAMRGARTVAMDADFGLANLDVVLGLPPGATVLDLLHGHARLDEALRPHVSGARVLAGCSGAAELVNLHPARLDHLLRTLSGIESSTDVLLVDVAAGIHDAAVTTLAAADEVLLVLAQDPSSFIDAYATVKCTLALRRGATFWVVVNSADSESEAKLFFAKFKAIVKEKLGTEVRYGGSILYDPAVGRAGLKRSPIMIECPGSPTSLAIAELATVLTHYEAKSVPIPLPEARGGFFDRLFRRGRTGERSPALSTRLP